MPDWAMLGPSLMLTPSLLSTVLPAVTLSILRSLANFTSRVSTPLATTPILLSLNLLASVIPPTTLTVSPNLRETLSPLSPAKIKGIFAASVLALMAS